MEAFEKFSLSAGFIFSVLPLIEHALHMEPVVESPHLVQKTPRLAPLQLLLHFFRDVLQCCVLILADDMCLAVGVWSAVLLVLVPHR